jgi:hypothetical protein
MGMVKITNKHPVRFRDRYDGKDYVFEPNEPVIMNDEAAKHIFGYGDPNKVPYLSRIGKMTTTQLEGQGGLKDAMKWLERFEFKEMVVKFEERAVEVIPFERPDEDTAGPAAASR